MNKKMKPALKDDILFENIACVKGVLELTLAAFSGDVTLAHSDSVQMLLIDASKKLDEINEALLQGA